MPTPRLHTIKPSEPTVPRFRLTITGPVKGPKPVSFVVHAADAKSAANDLKRLIATGKLTIEPL